MGSGGGNADCGSPFITISFSISLFHSSSSSLFCLSLSSLPISYSLSFSPQHPPLFLSIFCQICFFLINSSIFFSVKTWECRIFKFSVHYYDDGCPSGGTVPSLYMGKYQGFSFYFILQFSLSWTGSRDGIEIFWQHWIDIGQNKNLYWSSYDLRIFAFSSLLRWNILENFFNCVYYIY